MGCSGSNVKGNTTNEIKKPPVSSSQENPEGDRKAPSSGVDEVIAKGAVNFYSGILADNSSFYGEKLYTNQDQLSEFLDAIATQKVEYIDKGARVKPGVKYVKNNTDAFLNGQAKIDFSKQRLIVCQGSRLSSIEEKNGQISVVFDNVTMVRGNHYYAYVVDSQLDELDLGENFTKNDNMMIEQRPINNRVIEQRPINNRIIEQRPVNNKRMIIEQRPNNDNMIIEQRPINDNIIEEQRPINDNMIEEQRPINDNMIEEQRPLDDGQEEYEES
jgi:hypothetical protein